LPKQVKEPLEVFDGFKKLKMTYDPLMTPEAFATGSVIESRHLSHLKFLQSSD
jgi:hypothetical protein